MITFSEPTKRAIRNLVKTGQGQTEQLTPGALISAGQIVDLVRYDGTDTGTIVKWDAASAAYVYYDQVELIGANGEVLVYHQIYVAVRYGLNGDGVLSYRTADSIGSIVNVVRYDDYGEHAYNAKILLWEIGTDIFVESYGVILANTEPMIVGRFYLAVYVGQNVDNIAVYAAAMPTDAAYGVSGLINTSSQYMGDGIKTFLATAWNSFGDITDDDPALVAGGLGLALHKRSTISGGDYLGLTCDSLQCLYTGSISLSNGFTYGVPTWSWRARRDSIEGINRCWWEYGDIDTVTDANCSFGYRDGYFTSAKFAIGGPNIGDITPGVSTSVGDIPGSPTFVNGILTAVYPPVGANNHIIVSALDRWSTLGPIDPGSDTAYLTLGDNGFGSDTISWKLGVNASSLTGTVDGGTWS